MQPENLRFGGGATETLLHPVVAIAMLIAIAMIFLLPRKHVILPLLVGTFLIPLPQQILVMGLHGFVIRFLIAAGVVRMVATKLQSSTAILPGGFHSLDFAFLFWALFKALAPILLFRDPSAAVNSSGFLVDSL